MSTLTDIFERIAERRGWIETTERSEFDDEEARENDPDVKAKLEEKKLWNDIMKQLHEPFAIASQAMDEGMEHAGLLLGLIKPPKPKSEAKKEIDVEAKGGVVEPGDKGFTQYLEKKLEEFYSKRGEALKTWALQKGLSNEQWDAANSPDLDGSINSPDELQHSKDQQQLYLILYMEFLVGLILTFVTLFHGALLLAFYGTSLT